MQQLLEQSSAISTGAELLELFPSPVLHYLWPDSEELNRQLRDVILKRKERSAGVVKTNRGGWQSQANLETWEEAPVQILVGRIHAMIGELVTRTVPESDDRHLAGWKIRAWANVNEKGHFNRSHHHIGPNSIVSGVYYVDVGQIERGEAVSGWTVFEDRSRVAKEILLNPNPRERECQVRPQNGKMVLFPASLMHSVEPYSGDGFRITIAFNLCHPGFVSPSYPGMAEELDWWWINFRPLMLLGQKIPEKIHAIGLFPKMLLTKKPHGVSFLSFMRTAMDHAFALASERAERKRLRLAA